MPLRERRRIRRARLAQVFCLVMEMPGQTFCALSFREIDVGQRSGSAGERGGLRQSVGEIFRGRVLMSVCRKNSLVSKMVEAITVLEYQRYYYDNILVEYRVQRV